MLDFKACNQMVYRGGKVLPGLNALKFICVVLVLFPHINMKASVSANDFIWPIITSTIPVFLIISGYFLVSPDGTVKSGRVGKMFIKILKITVVSNLFYFLVGMTDAYFRDGVDAMSYIQGIRLKNLLFVGEEFCYPLWYLTALLLGLAVIWLASRLKITRLLYLFIPFGLLLNLLVGTYGFLFFDGANYIVYSRNVFSISLPCMMVGIWVRRHEYLFGNLPRVRLYAELSLLALYAEYAALSIIPHGDSWGDIYVFTLPLGLSLFLLFLKSERCNSWKRLADLGMRYSAAIYILHIFIMTYLLDVMPGINGYVLLALVVLSIMAVVSCWNMLKRRRNVAVGI